MNCKKTKFQALFKVFNINLRLEWQMEFTFVYETEPLMTYFDSSLGKIHFTSIGQQGTALLLIHGNGFSSVVFKPHINLL
jgi:hypothetical protein